MSPWRRIPQGIVAAGLIALLPHGARAQAEVDAGVGVTLLDRQAAVGSGTLTTSRQFSYAGDARIFVLPLGPVLLGAEAGYHHFWSYQAVYDSTTLVRRDVDADYLSLVARLPALPHLALDIGVGLQLFEGFSDPSVHVALRYFAAINPQLDFSFGGRADLVLDSNAKLLPVGLTIGISLKP